MPQLNKLGRHAVTVRSAEFGESPQGTPFLSLFFGDDAGDTITGYLYLSEKALANSVKTLRDVFGFDGNFETVIDQVTGKPANITVESEEYNGEDRIKVKWINAPRAVIENQDAFLKSLSAKAARIPAKAAAAPAPTRAAPAVRPPVASTPRQGVPPPARTTPGPAKPVPDDEVPF